MHSLNYVVDILMSKAYFLVSVKDFDPMTDTINSIALSIEEQTGLHCEDHIFFDDEDQISPYIAY